MPESRRIHERFDRELAVTLLLDGEELEGRTKNMSLGGMFLTTTRALQYGTQCKVRLRLPALKEDTEIPITVRWVTPEGIGVQFGSLRALEVWALNQLFKE